MKSTEKETRRIAAIFPRRWKRRGRRGLALLLVLAIIMSAAPQGFPQAVHAAVREEKRTPWYQITAKINSSWSGNIAGEFTITNISRTTAGSWQIDLPWAAQITSMWNGTYEIKDGCYIIRPTEHNRDIAPGESTTVGFLAEGDDETLQKIESAQYLEESGTQVTTSAERKEDWYHEPTPIPVLPQAPTPPVIETSGRQDKMPDSASGYGIPALEETSGALQTASALPDATEGPAATEGPVAIDGIEVSALPGATEGPDATDGTKAVDKLRITEKNTTTDQPNIPKAASISAATETPGTKIQSEPVSLPDTTDVSQETEVSTGDWHIYSDTTLTEDTVCDSLFLVGGKLRLNGHTLQARKNVSILADGTIIMDKEADTLQVGGDLLADSSKASTWNKGTLRLSGNLTQTGGAEEIPFQASNSFQIECTGKSRQTIALPRAEQTNLGVLNLNESAGVETEHKLKCSNITGLSQITNQDTLELEAASLNLSQNEESHSSIHLSGGAATLNKYRWDIHGNLTVSSGADKNITLPAGSCLSVDGNMTLDKGTLMMRQSVLQTGGNLCLGPDGSIHQYSENYTLQIGGSLNIQTQKYAYRATAKGTITVKGDIIQSEEAHASSFALPSQVSLYLEGDSPQAIRLAHPDTSSLGSLNLTGSAGVEINHKLKCSNITGLSQITNQDTLELEAASFNLSQDEESHSSIHLSGGAATLNKYRWDIHGNLTVSSGADKNITLPAGSCLSVDGNMTLDKCTLMMRQSVLQTGGNLCFGPDGSIHQYSENYTLQIGGNLNIQTQKYAYRATAKGTITVKGDIIQSEEAHVSSFALPSQVSLYLEGDSPQAIRLAHPDTSCLGSLNLTGSAGVEINHKLKCSNITGLSQITNQDTLELEAASFNLSQDEEINCSVILGAGLYSLNGHQWIIRGDLHIKMGQNDRLILPAGSHLSVKGDITLEQGQLQPLKSEIEADGDITLGAEGKLHSYAEEYHLKTGGSLRIGTRYAYPPGSGTITVGRDIIQEKNAAKDSFTLGYGVKVFLTGKSSQTISLPHTDYIDSLDITRSHGVQFRQDIKGNRLYGIEKINAPEGYDCYFDEAYAGGDGTLHGDLTCMGKLSTCGYNLTIDGNFEQYGDVWLKYDRISNSTDNTRSTLEVTGNYTAQAGILYVNMGEIHVHGNIKIKKNAALDMIGRCLLRTDGDFTMGSGDWEHSHMQGGTLAVRGDILQTPSSSVGSMKMAGTKLVLNGNKNQNVTLQDEIYEIDSLDMRESVGVTFASGNLKSSRILGFGRIQNPALTLSGGELFLEQEETYHGDLSLYSGMVNCNGHQLHIKGTLEQYGTVMQLGRGKLLVDGGYQLHSGSLRLLFEEDLLHVGGDFVTTAYSDQQGYLKNGRFELDGSFSQEGGEYSFASSEDFTIAFTGEEIQDVHFDDIQHSGFANIDPQYAGYRTNDAPVIMAGRLSYHIALGLIEGFQKMLGMESFQAVAVAAMAQLGITLVAGAVTLPVTVVAVATVALATISIIGDCFMAAQCLDSIYSATKGPANMYDRARIYARDGVVVLLSVLDGCVELIQSKEAIKGIFKRLSTRKPSGGGEEDVENLSGLFGNKDVLDFSQIENIEDVIKFLDGKVDREGLEYLRQTLPGSNPAYLQHITEVIIKVSGKARKLLQKDSLEILHKWLNASDTIDSGDVVDRMLWWLKCPEKGFMRTQLNSILENEGMEWEKFQELRQKVGLSMESIDGDTMKRIREKVPRPNTDTYLIKVIPEEDIIKYADGRFTEVGGFMAKYDDVSHLRGYDEVREGLRLDYRNADGSFTYPEGGNAYGYIKFQTDDAKKIEIPFGDKMGGTCTAKEPCTLNGFIGSVWEVIPEWMAPEKVRLKLKDGAELHWVYNGNDEVIGIFRDGCFQ